MKINISKMSSLFLLTTIIFLSYCAAPVSKKAVIKEKTAVPDTVGAKPIILGNQNLLINYTNNLKNKRVGLLTNTAGVTTDLKRSIDLFYAQRQINLTALFSPEHGIQGAAGAGEIIDDMTDPKTKLRVFSLYGKTREPDAEMLQNIDIILIDLQDAGLRGYTFIYTMAKMMKAAEKYHKEIIVLDRPNPLGGHRVEGNILEREFASFVGMYPIPYRYGMTIGELAQLFNNEFGVGCNLTVIPMKNWKREMLWEDTGLQWAPTSPHIPHERSPLYSCISGPLGELHTVSNGVGYTLPFEMIGAPWINAYKLSEVLNDLELKGIYFRPAFFKPYYAIFTGQYCQGVQIHLTDPDKCNLFLSGLYILQTLNQLYPEQNIFGKEDRAEMFNKVMGCEWILNDLQNNIPVKQIQKKWQDELDKFMQIREKYLLYRE